MRDKITKNIVISIIVLIVVYLALALWGNVDMVISTFKSFKWKFFPIILAIIYLTYILKFIKWNFYLHLSNIEIKTSDSFQIFMATLTMSVTPGKIGELIKPYMVRDIVGTPTSRTIPIVFAERVTEFLALIFLVILGIDALNSGIVISVISLLIFLILLITILNKNISNWLITRLSNIVFFQKYINPIKISLNQSRIVLSLKPFLLMFILSVVIWIIEGFAFYLVLTNFDINILFVESLFTYLFSLFIGAISFLPAGLGITDGSIAIVLANYGVNKEIAVSSALIIRIATLWFALLVGLISMLRYNIIFDKITKEGSLK